VNKRLCLMENVCFLILPKLIDTDHQNSLLRRVP
jgi:hypothetical protein